MMFSTHRILLSLLLFAAIALVSACGGSDSSTTLADVVEQVAGSAGEAASTGSGTANSGGAIETAKATVSARSLRVRAEPSPTAEVVGGIKEGEVYDVIGLSSDGEWIQLAVPAIPGGEGWVSANFVSVQGAITGATITEAAPVASGTTAETAGQAVGLPTATPRVVPQIPAVPGTATVATDGLRLRVRAEPSGDAEIVGYVYPGEVYEVRGATDDGSWTELAGRTGTDNVNGGWVATEYLVLN